MAKDAKSVARSIVDEFKQRKSYHFYEKTLPTIILAAAVTMAVIALLEYNQVFPQMTRLLRDSGISPPHSASFLIIAYAGWVLIMITFEKIMLVLAEDAHERGRQPHRRSGPRQGGDFLLLQH